MYLARTGQTPVRAANHQVHERERGKGMDKDEAISKLRELVKPGDTVLTILRHRSQSGMFRCISLVIPVLNDDGTPGIRDISWLAVQAVPGLKLSKRHYGIEQGGAGMDMGFHLVYTLSGALYGDGYPCVIDAAGNGRCPSNWHINGGGWSRYPAPHIDGYAVSQSWL